MDANKHTWEEDKKNMQKRINELNEYNTPEKRSPIAVEIKDMSEMSLQDREITQLKEANQELKDRILAKEIQDAAKEIRIVTRLEERTIGQIPLQGAKHFL